MSLHSVKKCPECNKDCGLFLDSTQTKSIWQCVNKHRFINTKGHPGKRIKNARSTNPQFKE